MEQMRRRETVEQLLTECNKQFGRYESDVGSGGFVHYQAQHSDVIVDSFMKSGTTLTQQIAYQLMCASGKVAGDREGEAFSDISEVVPFIEPMHRTGVITSRNPYYPRVFKSHAMSTHFDGKQRYIYCFRDAETVAASLFDFAFDWVVPNGRNASDNIRNEVYLLWVKQTYLEEWKGVWFRHVQSWREAGDKGWKVLFLEYEDMCTNLEDTIRKVARFIGIEVTDQVVAKVKQKCSRENMVGDVRFNDTLISKIMGWDEELGNRVRAADARSFKSVELSGDIRKEIERFYKTVAGVANFAELKRLLLSSKRQ